MDEGETPELSLSPRFWALSCLQKIKIIHKNLSGGPILAHYIIGIMVKPRYRAQSGFTLVEALVALMIISLTVANLYGGLVKINEFSAVNRLYTCATAIVQARIDRSLVDKPFNPGENQVHPDLKLGTETTPNVPVYIDPGTNKVIVSGTLTTVVSSTTLPITTGSSIGNVTLQKTDVSLAYQFQGKNYTTQLTCLRSPDKAQ